VPSFRYEAVDGAGRARRGLLDAASPRAVRDQLRGDGLFPTAIEAAGSGPLAHVATTRLAPPLLALLTRQLATLVASGMPLDQALSAVAEQSDQPRAARVLVAIREQVAAGEPLAAALSRFPRTFSELYRGLVAVGAESGQLGGVLSRLADYLEARQVLRAQFTAALIYPALITVIALAVIATLLLYVVPQIVAVYQQSRQALPFLTRALIATSDFLRTTGIYWLVALALLIVGAVLLLRSDRWRERWHALLLRAPVAGSVLRGLDTARFASTLAILTGSGAPLLRALDTAAAVVNAAGATDFRARENKCARMKGATPRSGVGLYFIDARVWPCYRVPPARRFDHAYSSIGTCRCFRFGVDFRSGATPTDATERWRRGDGAVRGGG